MVGGAVVGVYEGGDVESDSGSLKVVAEASVVADSSEGEAAAADKTGGADERGGADATRGVETAVDVVGVWRSEAATALVWVNVV